MSEYEKGLRDLTDPQLRRRAWAVFVPRLLTYVLKLACLLPALPFLVLDFICDGFEDRACSIYRVQHARRKRLKQLTRKGHATRGAVSIDESRDGGLSEVQS